jgi:hypothetical protein
MAVSQRFPFPTTRLFSFPHSLCIFPASASDDCYFLVLAIVVFNAQAGSGEGE